MVRLRVSILDRTFVGLAEAKDQVLIAFAFTFTFATGQHHNYNYNRLSQNQRQGTNVRTGPWMPIWHSVNVRCCRSE